MQIYGSVSRGQKAVKIKGAGFEFIMYSNTGIKNKTPLANGAENRTALNCYNQHNAAYNAVNKISMLV